jgi:hypothetical protein
MCRDARRPLQQHSELRTFCGRKYIRKHSASQESECRPTELNLSHFVMCSVGAAQLPALVKATERQADHKVRALHSNASGIAAETGRGDRDLWSRCHQIEAVALLLRKLDFAAKFGSTFGGRFEMKGAPKGAQALLDISETIAKAVSSQGWNTAAVITNFQMQRAVFA